MSIVYVVQRQLRKNHETGELEERFDISAADQYGDRVFLLEPDANPFRPREVVRDLHNGLSRYTGEDYILLIGNPCLIGWTTAIAAQYSGGPLRLLQWSGRNRCYLPIEVDIKDKGTLAR